GAANARSLWSSHSILTGATLAEKSDRHIQVLRLRLRTTVFNSKREPSTGLHARRQNSGSSPAAQNDSVHHGLELLNPPELLYPLPLQHLGDVDVAVRVRPDAVRAPEQPRVVR